MLPNAQNTHDSVVAVVSSKGRIDFNTSRGKTVCALTIVEGSGPFSAGHCGSTGDEVTVSGAIVGSSGKNLLIEGEGLGLAQVELKDGVDAIEHVANLEAVVDKGEMQVVDAEKCTMTATMSSVEYVEKDLSVSGYDVSACACDVTLYRATPKQHASGLKAHSSSAMTVES